MSESTKITLGQIQLAHDAWKTLVSLPLPAKLSYRIAKYVKKLQKEVQVIEEFRTKLVFTCAGKEPSNESVSLSPNSEGFSKFVTAFGEYLLQPSDLSPLDVSFEDVITVLDSSSSKLSVEHCSLLEPFFQSSTSTEKDS